MRSFTYSWQISEARAKATGELLGYAASNQFSKRGIQRGDQLYIVTTHKGLLYLLGKLEVDRIISYEEASAISGLEVFDATDHLFASRCTRARLVRVPLKITQALQFISKGGNEKLTFRREGILAGQTLRMIRELVTDSALLLDGLLDELMTFVPGQTAPSNDVDVEDLSLEDTCGILESLLLGRDPETGEKIPPTSSCQSPLVLQALRTALLHIQHSQQEIG